MIDLKAKLAEMRESARRQATALAVLAKGLPTLSAAQRAFLKRDDDPVVHWCDWSQQPDIHFACGVWALPAWGRPSNMTGTQMLPRESLAHIADDGSAYVFDAPDRVTCPACTEALWAKAAP